MAFTSFCQLPVDSTYRPVFYGKVNSDTCYCFNTEVTRQIVKDIITAKDCDTSEVLHDEKDVELDSLTKALVISNTHLRRENFLQEGVRAGLETKIVLLQDKVAVLERKNKFIAGGAGLLVILCLALGLK